MASSSKLSYYHRNKSLRWTGINLLSKPAFKKKKKFKAHLLRTVKNARYNCTLFFSYFQRSVGSLIKGLAKVFHNRPESRYFRFCRFFAGRMVSVIHTQLGIVARKQLYTVGKHTGLCSKKTLFTKRRSLC